MANNHRNFDEVITDVWTLELGITDRLLGNSIRINWQVLVMSKTKTIRLPIPVATPAPIVSRTYSYTEDYATNNCADTESEKNHLPQYCSVKGRGEAFGRQFMYSNPRFFVRMLRPSKVKKCLTEQYCHLPLIFGLFIASLVIFSIGYIVAQNQQNIALENAKKEAIAAQNKLQAVKQCVESIK